MPQNQMQVNGQDANNTTAYLTVNLADDQKEVRGFGQVVTRARTKQLAENYFRSCEKAEVILKEIETNAAYAQLKQMSEFADLKKLVQPASQTVSGVFGKEIILQILSMRQCEGIRYIMGHDGNQSTVMLIAVGEAGPNAGHTAATSQPVEMTSALRSNLGLNDIPVDGEVHGHSLTVEGVRQMLKSSFAEAADPTAPVFGVF